jgi:hypothetical protein
LEFGKTVSVVGAEKAGLKRQVGWYPCEKMSPITARKKSQKRPTHASNLPKFIATPLKSALTASPQVPLKTK